MHAHKPAYTQHHPVARQVEAVPGAGVGAGVATCTAVKVVSAFLVAIDTIDPRPRRARLHQQPVRGTQPQQAPQARLATAGRGCELRAGPAPSCVVTQEVRDAQAAQRIDGWSSSFERAHKGRQGGVEGHPA